MFSTYTGNKTLDFWLRGVAMTAPSRVWISLHTADPGPTGANEVAALAWPAYARQDPAGGGAVGTGFGAADDRMIANLLSLNYDAVDGDDPVVVTHYAVWDAATAGNCIDSGALETARTLQPTDEMVLRPGQVKFYTREPD